MFSQDPLPPFSFEPASPSPTDVLVSDSDSEDAYGLMTHPAKRRRIEEIARQYVAGQPIHILSASLKGPFDDGWINPWARKAPGRAPKDNGLRTKEPTGPGRGPKARITRTRPAPREQQSRRPDAVKDDFTTRKDSGSRGDRLLPAFESDDEYARPSLKLQPDGHAPPDRSKRRQDQETNRAVVRPREPKAETSQAPAKPGNSRAAPKRPAEEISTGTWLRARDGSAYSNVPARNDTASVTSELNHTPTAKRSRTTRYGLRQTVEGPSRTPEPPPATHIHSAEDLGEVGELDDPLRLWSQSCGHAPESPLGSATQRRTSPEQREIAGQQLHGRGRLGGVTVRQTDLADASAETIRSWMRAKELSVLAASQASQSASLRQSRSPSISRPLPSPIDTRESVNEAQRPTWRAPSSSAGQARTENKLERLSFSQPNPSKSRGTEQGQAADQSPTHSSPEQALRNSYRMVPPSTNLPAFRYWRSKSATANGPPAAEDQARPTENLVQTRPTITKPGSNKNTGSPLSEAPAKAIARKKKTLVHHWGENLGSNGAISISSRKPREVGVSKTSPSWLTFNKAQIEHPSAQSVSEVVARCTNGEPRQAPVNEVKDHEVRAMMATHIPSVTSTRSSHDSITRVAESPVDDQSASEDGSPGKSEPLMSTQAAVADMQRRFLADIESPALLEGGRPLRPRPPPDENGTSIDTAGGRPLSHSPLFTELDPGLRTPSADEDADEAAVGGVAPEPAFISTQTLLDAASPFTFSTFLEGADERGEGRKSATFASDADDAGLATGAARRRESEASALERAHGGRTVPHGAAGPFKSALKKRPAAASPASTTPSGHGSSPARASVRPAVDDTVELDTTIDEMMGSILEPWDVEKELQKRGTS